MGTIELRAFNRLMNIFEKNSWPFPFFYEIGQSTTGKKLLESLEIASEDVEVIFVNGLVQDFDQTIKPGDRVALCPPGTPGPYRVHLGFINKR